MPSCVLYQNEGKTAVLLDIPRSIELAQGTPEEPCLRKLISCKPLEKPFPSVEPKSAKARANLGEIPIKTLLLQKHIQFSLDQVKSQHTGPWYLPRTVTPEKEKHVEGPPSKKQKRKNLELCSSDVPGYQDNAPLVFDTKSQSSDIVIASISDIPLFHQNRNPNTTILRYTDNSRDKAIYIPPSSTLVNSLITTSESVILPDSNSFPQSRFNLILLDPPWPNRSVRRKHNYYISSTTTEIQHLLNSIPIPSLVASKGIVALWITNKEAFHNLILKPQEGIFSKWGLELIEEWVWVKITKDGEPMCAIDGSWRKPYEILLVARKISTETFENESLQIRGEHGIKRRVIFAVPDIHSRKPNLKELFETSGLLNDSKKYEALEVFARNMTAAWWSWGNEVVEFQKDEYWV